MMFCSPSSLQRLLASLISKRPWESRFGATPFVFAEFRTGDPVRKTPVKDFSLSRAGNREWDWISSRVAYSKNTSGTLMGTVNTLKVSQDAKIHFKFKSGSCSPRCTFYTPRLFPLFSLPLCELFFFVTSRLTNLKTRLIK